MLAAVKNTAAIVVFGNSVWNFVRTVNVENKIAAYSPIASRTFVRKAVGLFLCRNRDTRTWMTFRKSSSKNMITITF